MSNESRANKKTFRELIGEVYLLLFNKPEAIHCFESEIFFSSIVVKERLMSTKTP